MSNQPTAIVFDVFGTLVNIGSKKVPYRLLLNWMFEHGRAFQASDSKTIMAHDGDFKHISELLGMSIPDDFLQHLNQLLDEEIRSIYLFDDTLASLEHLKKSGFKIALCSNLATPYGQAVIPMLPNLDAYGWSYEIGAIKPEAKIYQHVADALNCPAQEILFIGDTPLADVEGPTKFGMNARLIKRRSGQTIRQALADLW